MYFPNAATSTNCYAGGITTWGVGIVNKAGAATKAEFSVQKDIEKMVSTNSDKDGDGGTPLKPGAGSTDQKDNTQQGGGSTSDSGTDVPKEFD